MKTTLLIFGITGDLSRRKLLPALEHIVSSGEFDDLTILGVSRREIDIAALLRESLGNTTLLPIVSGITMDLARPEDYERLRERLALSDEERLLIYLAVPPQSASQIVDFLGEARINTPNVTVLFEKPFGADLASARDMIARTERYYTEHQIYRIDHYLAKEMAQNIVAFRGGNALFSHIWNDTFIESIEIVALEHIDIEGRAQFYEQTGALRDLVQGHLMQLLALTLMDIPHDFDWNELPALRLKALEYIRPVDPSGAVRAQYNGYQNEVENIGSLVETFVSIPLVSDQPRWLDVPLRLTTGKALNEKRTEVRVSLKKLHEAQSNTIVFRIQPHEGVSIGLYVKKPGYDREFEQRHLDFSFATDERIPDGYEQVLVDAIRSHKSLFTSSAEVVRSWEILAPLQYAWSMDNTPLPTYKKGSTDDDIRHI